MSLAVRRGPLATGHAFHRQRKCLALNGHNLERCRCSKVVPDFVTAEKPQPSVYINNKVNELLQWYEEFSGLRDVRVAQDKVIEAGDKLARIQEERRQASAALAEIQLKLKEIYAELDNTKRGDDRYVYLITEEHKLLKEEESRQEKFKEAERTEREQFSILTNSVKVSHEKERTQAEKTKYWSIIGSVIGTIIGIIGTSINNHFRMSELRQLIQESSNKDVKQMEAYENSGKTAPNISDLTLVNNTFSEHNKSVEDLLTKLNARLINVEESVKKIETTQGTAGSTKFHIEPDGPGADLLVLHFNSLTESIVQENRQIKILLFAASFLCIAIPIVTNAFTS